MDWYHFKRKIIFQLFEDGFFCLLLFLRRSNRYRSVVLEWTEIKTYEVKFYIFVILTILMTSKQTKSYTTTNLYYCSLQKIYFRCIFFCGFRNVLSTNKRKCIHSVFSAVFKKTRVSETNCYIYMENKCTSFKSDSQNVLWLCVSFLFSNFVITLLAHGYCPVL